MGVQGKQIDDNTTPIVKLETGTPNQVITYDDTGNPIETPNLKVFNNGDVDITGTVTATDKYFKIIHPSKDGYYLQHSAIEGPETTIFFRGNSKSNEVKWPSFWTSKLIDFNTITVHLTPRGPGYLWVSEVDESGFKVENENNVDFDYWAVAERVDVKKVEVEKKIPE